MASVVFYLLSGVSLAMALVVAGSRRPIYAALALVGCLCSVGGLYVLLGATFLAAVQIVVYAGAVGIAFLIATVLLDTSHARFSPARPGGLRWGALLVGLVFFVLIAVAVVQDPQALPGNTLEAVRGSLVAVGHLALSKYLVPFAGSIVVALASVLGAIRLARP